MSIQAAHSRKYVHLQPIDQSLAYFTTCQKAAEENYINIEHFPLSKVPQI